MQQRQLGTSDIRSSVITFGAWAIGGAMWGPADEQDAIAAIRTYMDMGGVSIDTAPLYGFGHSERLVAKAIAGKRDKVQIFTKYGLRVDTPETEFHFEMNNFGKPTKIYKNSRKASIMWEVEESLRNLETDYIDLYQCHWRDHTTPIDEPMEVMDKLLKQGKIRAAGLSNYSVDEIEEANSIVPIASVQPPYSMVNRGIEKDILPYCHQHNIGVIVYSPLQRGLLTGKFKPDHKFGPFDHRAKQPFFKPENISRVNAFLEKLQPIAEEHKATIAQIVINWTFNQKGVTSAIVGARNAKQSQDNASAANFQLTEKELAEITAMLDELKLVS